MSPLFINLTYLKNYKINGVQPFKFQFASDISEYELKEVKSVQDMLCGSAGSILSKYHNRKIVHYDDKTIKRHKLLQNNPKRRAAKRHL